MLKPPTDGPKILIYDIETTPHLVYTWRLYDANAAAIHTDSQLLCFAYKWHGKKQVGFEARWTDGDPEDDRNVAEALHSLFNEADATLAYNGDRFDRKKANTRFLFHGLGPPAPCPSIDPLKLIKREFAHDKNTLENIARYHNQRRKKDNEGIGLWLGAMAGDSSAQRKMEAYNRGDVNAVEDIYLMVRPWYPANSVMHPNLAHWADEGELACGRCGSDNVWKRGTRPKKVGVYQRFQCRDCGGWSEARTRIRKHKGGVRLV